VRIALAQLDPVVGDFAGNLTKIRKAYERACDEQARFLLTPELSLCGYPPLDLIDRPEMLARNEAALAELQEMTRGRSCALVVGHISRSPFAQGRAVQNSVSVLEAGGEVFRQAKSLLPAYDIFDEPRYFEPAREIALWDCDGTRVALAICEDLWAGHEVAGRKLHDRDPWHEYQRQGAQLICSVSASPYEWGKREIRESVHRAGVERLGVPLVYINSVGATDEVLFDGASFVLDAGAKPVGRLPAFQASFALLDWEPESGSWAWVEPGALNREDQAGEETDVLRRGLVLGIREYLARCRIKQVVLGLSGGIDSAVVAALAVEALGAENVTGVAMPSQYSSGHSLEDAEKLAANLGIRLLVKPIKFLFTAAQREIGDGLGTLAPIAQENLQSRLRALILLAISNHEGSLVLTTGNKSELAMGYCTLYGDMCGGIAPLGDVLKTRVYALAQHLNREREVIPVRTIEKPPSAELKPGQTDQDSLPPYELLDAFLEGFLERGESIASLEARLAGRDTGSQGAEWMRGVLKRFEGNEFKRRQAAPVLKVSPRAFGLGRRVPVARVWES
jgi:NAD+ synthase (glutamine-hydrolysing)